ncbi:Methyltransferase domain-containing protein [Pustulibacterium marinum]|uniref:Methyltransferase domain-containing protein n=2 Tax=Pustulibacterium marinum TaxID=1224947 RepID=A0A1I7G9N9_9FLAO|nr:Methyltransferase domain-containing protein [Pustulibacterium marinum]
MQQEVQEFITAVTESIQTKTLHRLTISGKKQKSEPLQKVIIKLVQLKNGEKLSFVYRYKTQDITKNFDIEEGISTILALFDTFANAVLFTPTRDLEIRFAKKRIILKSQKPTFTSAPTLSHNKKKKRYIDTKGNVYLTELGVLAANGQVKANMHDKYRQINKFIEIFDSLLEDTQLPKNLTVADMGSGKGYLTFAMYDYLNQHEEYTPEVVGVEFREGLVATCNAIAKKSNFEQLQFVQGMIETADINAVNILIALHACDTATDEALYKGINANANLIVVAPCCHKQIRKAFHVDHEFSSFLKHGILEERQAELITDAIRALILEAYGYKTKVFEFISSEHTAKNVMITAQKTQDITTPNPEILEKITSIKKFYGIKEHHLEKLMGLV